MGVSDAAGTTSEKSDNAASSARKRSHWPMPPPIPLSGAGAWYSAGSQLGSASSSAKRGRIASHASTGEPAVATVVRTWPTKSRTTGVSSANSPFIVLPLRRRRDVDTEDRDAYAHTPRDSRDRPGNDRNDVPRRGRVAAAGRTRLPGDHAALPAARLGRARSGGD